MIKPTPFLTSTILTTTVAASAGALQVLDLLLERFDPATCQSMILGMR